MSPTHTHTQQQQPVSVVVLGSGHVGKTLARALEEAAGGVGAGAGEHGKVEVTVVDRQASVHPSHHKLGEVRAMVNGATTWSERERVPLTHMYEKTTRVVVGEVVRIDHSAKRLVFKEANVGPLPYDVLVVATGSPQQSAGELPTHLLGRDEVREYFAETSRAIKAANRVCIVGGAASAVEYATEIRAAYPHKEIRIIATAAEEVSSSADASGRKASVAQRAYVKLATMQIAVTRGERVVSPEWKDFAGKKLLVGQRVVTTSKGNKFEADLVLLASTWNAAVSFFPLVCLSLFWQEEENERRN